MNEELKTVNDELQVKVEELARSQRDLHNLVIATQVATLFVDAELRVNRFTPALAEVFNILPTDHGRPLTHLTHALDYDELPGDCEVVLRTLEPVEREVPGAGGRTFLARVTPYRSDGDEPGGAVVTFTEITGIRKAEEEVLASEQRFRVLVEATAQIVWTTDAEGRMVRDSPSWRAFTGQTVEEWQGNRWSEVVHPDDRAMTQEQWQRALQTQEKIEVEFRLWYAPEREWRVVRVRAVPVRNQDGSVREWVGMNTDITTRKDAELALIRAKAEAEKSDLAKSQFLSMLSHELRTPLTAVIGSSELLETGVIDPVTDRHREHLRRIKASAWHLVTIINEILTYTRSEAGKDHVHLGQSDVAAITRDVVSMLETEADARGLQLRLHGADAPISATTDRGKVRQIITNLVGNALKFTRQGSVDVELKGDADQLEIVIRDTGCGIAREHLEEVFQPFFQIDNSSTRTAGGTGLGLAVCRRLARALGGEVLVESAPGEGSVFRLRLPRHCAGDAADVDAAVDGGGPVTAAGQD
jgi:two-component system, chemotaxis family, CheB/CheR fusion protein